VTTDARCTRGQRCTTRTTVMTDDGRRLGALGALLADPDAGLCPGCLSRLVGTLDDVPVLLAALAVVQRPTMEVRYRTMDVTGGGSVHPPLVIDTATEALVRLLDHELTAWVEFVADHIGEPWSSDEEAHLRQADRVARACTFLGLNATTWAGLGSRDYVARSLTFEPTDAPGPGVVLDAEDRPWGPDSVGSPYVRRTGAEAATVVLDLVHGAQQIIGAGGSDLIPVPCSSCGRRRLHREHALGVVRCRGCRAERSDDGHDAFLSAALADPAQLAALADLVTSTAEATAC